jgi:hypothetical protein
MEAAPIEVGKDKAVDAIFSHYQKKYDIVGMSYSGDALNDIRAIRFVTKFSEVPGVNSFVFLPSNANDKITDPKIEGWKDKLGEKSKGRIINVGDEKYFDGVINLIKDKYEKGELLGKGCSIEKTTDDIALGRKEKDEKFLEKLHNFKDYGKMNLSGKGLEL